MAHHPYYFAFGSNMNSARMLARGLDFLERWPAVLRDYQLVFNKRAHNKQGIAYANIRYCPGERVEGVLYALESARELAALDHYEGTPVRYSREVFRVETPQGGVAAWTYVANPAYIESRLRVEERYLEHLLEAAPLLSAEYLAQLRAVEVEPSPPLSGEERARALQFNL